MKKQSQAAAAAPTIVSSTPAHEGEFGIHQLAQIRRSPDNRKRFDPTALQELAASIKAMGVAQPILIRPVIPTTEQPELFEIVAGERRYRASTIAGMATIPAMVRTLSDLDAAKIRILENLQREDPHPMEEAEGYEQLMMRHGYSADQLAEEIKKSRSYVYGRLKLCALTTDVRARFLDNKIPASTALLIARIPTPDLQVQALREITAAPGDQEQMSVRRASEHIQRRYMLDLADAIFPIADAKLLATAGSCVKCPKRTGNQPEIFADVKSADICTDPDCYGEKRAAHHGRIIVLANKKGIPVLEGDAADDAMPEPWNQRCEFVEADTNIYHFRRNAPATQNAGTAVSHIGQAALPPVAMYLKESNGDVTALYKRSDLQAALEKSGACETEEKHAKRMDAAAAKDQRKVDASPDNKAAERRTENQLVAERETTFRVALYKKLRTRMAGGLSLDSLREFVKLILLDDNYYSLPNDLLDVYGLDNYSDDSVCAYIDQANLPEVQLILVDLVLGECLGVASHQIEDDLEVEQEDCYDALLSMARHEGIDPDDVREELFPAPAAAAVTAVPAQEDAPDEADQLADMMAEDAAKPPSSKRGKVKFAPAAAWPFPQRAIPK